jgi:hypothetical protein
MFEQERFVGRLQRHAQSDAAVLVCFLHGSFGRRAEDAYSDVDCVLVYAGGAERDSAWNGRQEFIKGVNPYVAVRSFDAVHVRPYLHIALYGNGTKADFAFERMDALAPDPIHREIRILKDSDHWAEQLQAASSRLAPPQPYISPADLAELDNRFWVMLWDTLRLLKRGDADKPFAIYLQTLYFTLPPLLDALPPEEPARRALLNATYGRDVGATARALGELLEAYLAARAAVIRRQNLMFPINTAFESEIRRLVERLSR